MNATATTVPIRFPIGFQDPGSKDLTLLELVGSVCDVTDDDEEVIATVIQMLLSGRVRLCGNFRGASGNEFA